jgi:hypothetical protein
MSGRICAAVLIVAVAFLAACGSRGGAFRAPPPAAGDTAGRIMSVTGDGFTICDVSDSGSTQFDVVVCGDLVKARAALQRSGLAEVSTLHAYQPLDGGPHGARALVVQWWVSRAAGPDWSVTMTEIIDDTTVDVEVKGDLAGARATLDAEFPDWLRIRAQSGPDRVLL